MQKELFPTAKQSRLSEGFPDKLAIIDCETTGGKSEYHRIIEIGVVLVDEGQLTKRWKSFIDPERPLPPFISTLTGITSDMLEGQPLFTDIAEELFELLSDRIFVAHNARFDYSFIRKEFERVGINFSAKTLCSVKLSRQLYPQFKRHSLEAIIKRFGFEVENRHRALDDAEMVWEFFLKTSELLDCDEIAATCAQLLKNPSLPPNIKKKEVKALPKLAGVYYFYDDAGKLLYIGKSVNIQARVMSHFSQDHRSSKERSMCQKIAHIDYQRTPGDFGAQLLESNEIKALSPIYNRRLRRIRKLFSLQREHQPSGYDTVSIRESMSDISEAEDIGLFRSPRQAGKRLEKLADDFFLCHKLLGLEGNPGDNKPCFRRQLKRCFGACEGAEPAQDYNRRLHVALNTNRVQTWPFQSAILVKERSLTEEEFQHYHLIDQWRYLGRVDDEHALQEKGFCFREHGKNEPMQKDEESINEIAFDLDIYRILLRFLMKEKDLPLNGLEVIPLARI